MTTAQSASVDRERGPIRVLHALTTAQLGGTEMMVLRLLRRIDRSRVECDVSVLDGGGPLVEAARNIGVNVIDLSGRGAALGACWRFRLALRSYRYDIVHMYGFRMSVVGRLGAHRPGPKIIHGIRGLHTTEAEEINSWKTRVALTVEKLGATRVDLYVANSHGAVDFLRNRGVRGRFLVIHNGIECPVASQRPRNKQFPEILVVAGFRPRKRHQDVVTALQALRARGVVFRCTMVGDGPTRPGVEALVHAAELDDAVEFAGNCTPAEVAAHLNRADLFVLPSLWEGLPGAVMEAMASGLPVVATDVSGTRELVVDGVTGYLVPARNPDALADRIQILLEDAGAREVMGRAGRSRMLTEFSLDVMVSRHEELYEALDGRRSWPGWAEPLECAG